MDADRSLIIQRTDSCPSVGERWWQHIARYQSTLLRRQVHRWPNESLRKSIFSTIVPLIAFHRDHLRQQEIGKCMKSATKCVQLLESHLLHRGATCDAVVT